MSLKYIKTCLFIGACGAASWLPAQTVIMHTLNQAPALVAEAGQAVSTCVGDSVLLGGGPSASGGTSPYTYSWSPATGLSDPSGANPVAGVSGSQTYTLMLTDSVGCSTYDSVQVNAVVVAAGFSSSANLLSVAFTDLSTNAGSYSWTFGDGNTSTQQNPTHVYTAAGTYTVCLTVDGGTACEDSSCTTITVIEVGLNNGMVGRVMVYPNPAAGNDLNFLVEGLQASGTVSIQLMDMSGKVVRNLEVENGNGTHTLSIRGLAKGTYMYQLNSTESKFATGKIVIQ